MQRPFDDYGETISEQAAIIDEQDGEIAEMREELVDLRTRHDDDQAERREMREKIDLLEGQVELLLVSVLRWPTENLMLIISFCRDTWRSLLGTTSHSTFATNFLSVSDEVAGAPDTLLVERLALCSYRKGLFWEGTLVLNRNNSLHEGVRGTLAVNGI